MGKLKIISEDDVSSLERAASEVYKQTRQKIDLYVDFSLVSAEEIRELNRINRGVDAVTDVLSFPLLDDVKGKEISKKEYHLDYDEDEKAVFLGSVAVCKEKIVEQAKEFGHSEERELTYLFVHSLFHLFGYDHINETDKTEMREKEENVMKALGITR